MIAFNISIVDVDVVVSPIPQTINAGQILKDPFFVSCNRDHAKKGALDGICSQTSFGWLDQDTNVIIHSGMGYL
jgi:hypothetical protein